MNDDAESSKIILNITPQTHVRATQGDRIYFRIPRDKLRPAGLKRLLRLERYNEYKIAVSALAKSKRYTTREQGEHITFYIPVSASWSKKKKAELHLQIHQEKPDIDNLLKAFFDSLMFEDKHIGDVRITKRWVNQERGWIEIVRSNPTYSSPNNLI